MKPLAAPDLHHLLAAQGWLELVNQIEAGHELEKIIAPARGHPDVINLRWEIYGRTRHWQTMLSIARAICLLEPIALIDGAAANPRTDCRRSSSGSQVRPRMTGGIRFPHFFAIPYNLACYACRIDNLTEAWEWFKVAAQMVDITEVRRLALNDPDLEPLWHRIREL